MGRGGGRGICIGRNDFQSQVEDQLRSFYRCTPLVVIAMTRLCAHINSGSIFGRRFVFSAISRPRRRIAQLDGKRLGFVGVVTERCDKPVSQVSTYHRTGRFACWFKIKRGNVSDYEDLSLVSLPLSISLFSVSRCLAVGLGWRSTLLSLARSSLKRLLVTGTFSPNIQGHLESVVYFFFLYKLVFILICTLLTSAKPPQHTTCYPGTNRPHSQVDSLARVSTLYRNSLRCSSVLAHGLQLARVKYVALHAPVSNGTVRKRSLKMASVVRIGVPEFERRDTCFRHPDASFVAVFLILLC